MPVFQNRTTKYTVAVLSFLQRQRHCTNLDIVEGLRQEFPELSKTTVHRVTSRLLSQGKIRSAPATHNNASRFDSNVLPHDHFRCNNCDRLRDIHVPQDLLDSVYEQLGNCKIDGDIVISGVCSRCSGHRA